MRYIESFSNANGPLQHTLYKKEHHKDMVLKNSDITEKDLNLHPWFFNAAVILRKLGTIDPYQFDTVNHVDPYPHPLENITGFWTWPYFRCSDESLTNKPSPFPHGKWIISYSVAFANTLK